VTLVTQDLREKQRDLREANRAFFAAANGAAKRAVQKRIRSLREEIAAEVKREHTFAGDDADRLAAWDPFDPNAFAPFFDGEWMFGLDASADEGWFDIAFANPPYIRQEKIESFRVNEKPVIAKAQLKADYKTYVGTADIYVYFYERALRLLKPLGALAFITSNKWYRAGYGKGLREWLSTHARILKIIDFGDAPVFEAIAYPTILIGTRKPAPGKPSSDDTVQALNWTIAEGGDPKESVKRFSERFDADAFAVPQADLLASGWQLEPQTQRDLLARLRTGGVPLGKLCNDRFYRGITTGLNGAFVLDGSERAKLIASDPNSAEVIKPFLRGRDIKRWKVEPADNWLLFVPWHFPLQSESSISGASRKAESEFAKRYPAIFAHLERHKAALEKRNRAETGIRYEWYALQRWAADYWEDFQREKIVFPDIALRPQMGFDAEGHFLGNTGYIIPTDDKSLLAVLNSSTTAYFYSQISPQIQNGYYRFIAQYVGQIPIPPRSAAQSEAMRICVDAMIVGSQRSALEALINAFVYELFFADELHARNLRPFDTARMAGLMNLAHYEGPALARAADEWSRRLADPANPLYATLFDLQSIDVVRIIEGRP
jgi:hypothetical protein